MTAVSPVMPHSESIEVVLGEGQDCYENLPAVYLQVVYPDESPVFVEESS